MIYIINGKPESGKSTFCQMVIELMGENFAVELSTVDKVKEIATYCGWDGTKTLKNRQFLSDLKDLLTKWGDVPVKDIKKRINAFYYTLEYFGIDPKKTAIFINCREPDEIKRLCEELDAKSILVVRDTTTNCEVSNHADKNVFNYDYDITIRNNFNLDHLKLTAQAFIKKENLYKKGE